jgi:hypothetical protein
MVDVRDLEQVNEAINRSALDPVRGSGTSTPT